MTNEEYVNLFYARKDLEREVDKLYKKKEKLQKKLDKAVTSLIHSEEVDEIWDGHAVSIMEDYYYKSLSTGRFAIIYPNTQIPKYWGVRLNTTPNSWSG